MLYKISHENIIKYYCLLPPKIIDTNKFGVFMEYMPGGNLEFF